MHVVDTYVGRCRAIVEHVVRVTIHDGTRTLTYAIVFIDGYPALSAAYATSEVAIEGIFQQRHVVGSDGELVWLAINHATTCINAELHLVSTSKGQRELHQIALTTSVGLNPIAVVALVKQARQRYRVLFVNIH